MGKNSNHGLLLTIFSCCAIGVWFLSGMFRAHGIKDTAMLGEKINVAVYESHAQKRNLYIDAVGDTDSVNKVEVLPEVNGQVTEIIAKDGDIVKKGDSIIRIEDYGRTQQLEAAKYQVELKGIVYKSSKALRHDGYNSKTQEIQAALELRTAEAQLKKAQIEFERSLVRAPIAGVIGEVMFSIGDIIPVGSRAPITTIRDFSSLLVHTHIPNSLVGQISNGTKADVTFSDGTVLQGRVTFVDSAANTNTKAYRVDISIKNQPEKLSRSGLVVNVRLLSGKSMAHKIPSSSLVLSDSGVIGVNTLDKNNVVKFRGVNIIESTKNETWVTNLNEQRVRIITRGQLFVRAGDVVEKITMVDIAGNPIKNTSHSTKP